MKKTITHLLFSTLFFVGFCAHGQIVTTTADDGSAGTLRNQIASADSGDVIIFGLNVDNIVLTMGQITIDKSLIITGNGLSTTTVNGNMAGRIFNITSGEVAINDLTITNGLAENGGAIQVTEASLLLTLVVVSNSTAIGASGSGGGIFIGTGGELTATNSTLNNNTANRAGGAIEMVAGTTITLNNVDLIMNKAGIAPATAAPGNGGGIHITGNATAIINGGTINNNMAAAEGGGLWNGSGIMTIIGTVISANTASGIAADNGGGGIYNLNGGTLNIEDSEIKNNEANGTAGSGGGILNDIGATLTIVDTEITGNTSNRAGGGIENNAGTVNLENVTLNGNTTFTAPGNGGGLHVSGAGLVTIVDGEVNDNIAGSEGGGLWNGTATMSINGTTISRNTASGASTDNGGGGIYNLNTGILIIEDSEIKDNVANGAAGSGGGILNDVGASLSVLNTIISGNTSNRAGGGIENNAGTVTLTNVSLNDNTTFTTPGNGGGLHVTGAGLVTITDGEVKNNTAGSEGGGLWNGTGVMEINGTTISENTASGMAADNGGGGIYNFNGGTLTIADATISENVANGTLGSGGGILNDVGSQLSIRNTVISGNTAVRAGGGIEDNSGTSTITLTNVNLDNNSTTGPPGNGGGLHITGTGNVTITGGTINGNTAALEGGGLWNGAGIMTVSNTEITSNDAGGNAADDGGGGIFNNGGTLSLENTVLFDNLASGTAGSGGGLFSIAGAITISNSSFEFNSANRAGGAIEVIAGNLTLNNTDLSSNDVNGSAGAPAPGIGGGIHISGITTTIISGGTISGNGARREGGGLWNQVGSEMTINNVTLDDNYANGLQVTHGGGAIFVNGGTVNVNSSTISNNEARGAGLGSGGGIHIKAGGIANVNISTISGNGSVNDGGGIYNNGSLFIDASTIANNAAAEVGGGIANEAPVQLTIKNTIIALNIADTGTDVAGTGDFTSLGYNLIGQDDANVFTTLGSDLEGTVSSPIDPMVGPLANNGGSTMTHQLLAGSPAYNAGDPLDLFNDQTNSPIFGGIRDIGAFEAQSQLGVGEIAFNNKRSVIYPNPAINGSVNIRLAETFVSEINGRLIDLGTGKMVKQFKVNSAESGLDISEFGTGIYAIVLSSADFSETHKLIISK